MNARNPKHTASGLIEMEIEHPTYGWIPFAASPNDSEAHGRELYARAMAGEFGVIAARDLIPNPRIAEIKSELTAIDAKRIRPIAEGDTAYLATLNAQAVALREELATLPALI